MVVGKGVWKVNLCRVTVAFARMFGCEIPQHDRGLRTSVHRQQSDPKMKEKAEKLEAGEVSAPVTTSLVEGLCKEEMYRGCLLQREIEWCQGKLSGDDH